MIPCVSAGSNQVGAKDTWMAQVSWSLGAAAKLTPEVPATSPRALRANTSRRDRPVLLEPLIGTPRLLKSGPIKTPPNLGYLREPCAKRRRRLRKCLDFSGEVLPRASWRHRYAPLIVMSSYGPV